MKKFELVVDPQDAGKRLDVYLTENLTPHLSRSAVKALIVEELVSVNSKPAKPSCILKPEDKVSGCLDNKRNSELEPYNIELRVVFEDEYLLVIDKPSGLTVHPGAGNRQKTLVSALIARNTELSSLDIDRPGIVHRLDKDTSGLIVVAKNSQIHLALSEQFKERKVEKKYLAVVEGQVQFDEGKIEAPIAVDKLRRERMRIDFSSMKPAVTYYKTIKRESSFSVVELKPVTGRTHQLRLHMRYLGHPIIGDSKYPGKIRFKRLMLHAFYLSFFHPGICQKVEFNSKPPQEFEELINSLGKN